MKKLSYFISLACIALFASCSSDVEEFNAERSNTGDGMMTVAVSMPGQGDSRVDFSGDVTNMTWNYGDELRAVGYYQGIPSYSYTTYSQPTDAGYTIVDNKAIFKGSKLQVWTDGNHDCDEYRMVYHSPSLEYYCSYGEDDINCNYNGQIYGGYAGESEPDAYHLRDHLYMTTGKLKADNVKNTIQGGTLVPQCAVLRLNIESLPEALQNKSAYKIKFFVNYEGKVQPIATIDYRVPIVNGKYIYMAFDPANDLKATSKIGFEISDAGETVTYKVSALSQNGKNYEPAKVYTVNLTNGTPWTWVNKAEEVIEATPIPFKETFDSDLGQFSVAGFNGDNNDIWSNLGSAAFANAYSKIDADNLNYLVSDPIQLGSKDNAIRFDYIFNSYYNDNDGNPKAGQLAVCVKLANSDTWTELNFTFVKSSSLITGCICDIPAEFNDKVVNIGFKYYAKSSSWAAEFTVDQVEVDDKANFLPKAQ